MTISPWDWTPGYRRLFVEYLRDFAAGGDKTIFLTSHIIQDMELLIDDCMILDYGRLLIHKPTREIMENFHRFRFSLNEGQVPTEHEKLWNTEKITVNGLPTLSNHSEPSGNYWKQKVYKWQI